MDYRTEVVKKSTDPKPSSKKNVKKSEFWHRMELLLGHEDELNALREAFLKFQNNAPKAFRINPLRKISIQDYQKHFPEMDFHKSLPWSPFGFRVQSQANLAEISKHPLVCGGAAYIQEPSALEPVEVLAPKPGETVLDLCAAPGGKATQIGERLNLDGWLVANDPVRSRAERLDALVARHGIVNSSIFSLAPSNLAEKFPGVFDAILVDAPCGGESLFAKRIDHRTDIRDKDVKGNARRQFLILNCAMTMLKPGGRLVYSTCTYSKEENEEVIKDFLDQNPDLQLVKEQRRWPHKDQAAGGYWALLTKKGERDSAKYDFLKGLSDTQGLIRTGTTRWNNEQDIYAESMNPNSTLPKVELSLSQAKTFLKGQTLDAQTLFQNPPPFNPGTVVVFTWNNIPLGPAKYVESRFNNLLPKVLINR